MQTLTFEEVISKIVENSDLHGRFVNTLSLLEYMGARKILKSQKEESVSAELLGHISEEIRHAQIFKHFALKLSAGRLVSYEDEFLLCGPEARNYFQTLDELSATELGSRGEWKNYLLTTLLIEERATAIYPIYERVLKEKGIPNVLNAVIRDEDAHLGSIEGSIQSADFMTLEKLERLRLAERELFEKFLEAIARSA